MEKFKELGQELLEDATCYEDEERLALLTITTCQKNNIDEDNRKIGILAYKFEKNEQDNYNQWESKILNKYYDVTLEGYNPFKQMDNDF